MKIFHHIYAMFIVLSTANAGNSAPLNLFNATKTIKLDKISWEEYNAASSVWINSEKEEFDYNSDGVSDEVITYIWSLTNGNWIRTDKSSSKFEMNLLVEEVKSQYDALQNMWIDTLKKEYVYNNDLLSTCITYERSSNLQAWTGSMKEELNYDSNGNKTDHLYMVWSKTLNEWENTEQDVYTYDAQNRVITYTSKIWDFLFNEWLNYEKEEYAYGTNPTSENYTYYLWNSYTKNWENNYKDYFEYYNNDLSMGFLSWYWDASQAKWIDLTKEVHEFDANKNLIYFAEYDWNENTVRWDYYDKETYTYDANNNPIMFIDYDRRPLSNQWIEHSKEVYTYNSDIKNADMMLPYSDTKILDFYFKTQLLSTQVYEWNKSTSTWINSAKGTFSYSDFIVSNYTNQIIAEPIQFYPNPATEAITFSNVESSTISTIEIFNLNGSKVLETEHNLNSPFNLNFLNQGLYVVRIQLDNNQIFTLKLIKQ